MTLRPMRDEVNKSRINSLFENPRDRERKTY
jgi:hypothetical protein